MCLKVIGTFAGVFLLLGETRGWKGVEDREWKVLKLVQEGRCKQG